MRLTILFLALCVTFSSAATADATRNKAVTRGELDGLIRQYLLDNPQVIVDALEGMQRQEMEKASAEAAKVVKENTQVVYSDAFTPSVGPKNAAVTIVEFSDYNCSACKFMFNAIDRLLKEQKGKVRLLIKEFPIFGAQSHELAAIAIAANQLDADKYFAFHSTLMREPGRLDANKIDAALTNAGYDPKAVRARAEKDDIKAAIARNLGLGEKLGLRGTPTLIVGDEVVPHALDFETLSTKVSAQSKR